MSKKSISEITDIRLDFDSLNMGEVYDLEEALDADFSVIISGGVRKMKVVLELALITLRRDFPDITMEDVRALPFDILDLSGKDSDVVDPT